MLPPQPGSALVLGLDTVDRLPYTTELQYGLTAVDTTVRSEKTLESSSERKRAFESF